MLKIMQLKHYFGNLFIGQAKNKLTPFPDISLNPHLALVSSLHPFQNNRFVFLYISLERWLFEEYSKVYDASFLLKLHAISKFRLT